MRIIEKNQKYIFLLLSILFVLYFTLLNHASLGIGNSLGGINLKIFNTIQLNSSREALIGTVGNVILFVPLGTSLTLTCKRNYRFLKVVVLGLLFSVMIEIFQLLLPNRWTDVNDVILNTIGTIIGYLFYVIGSYLFSSKKYK